MGVTAMLKVVLLLAWLCMVGAQFSNTRPVFFPDSNRRPSTQQVPVTNNRQSQISSKPRCTNNLEVDYAPCLEDEDYNANVRTRFRHLIDRFRGREVVTNEVFQALSKPEVIVDLGRMKVLAPICDAEEVIIFPKRAKTAHNEWVFVLNQDNTNQGVKVEKCSSNNQACRLGAARVEVDTVCRQKYIYKKLLVMNGAGTDIVPESVLMPSCCVCYTRKEDNFFSGFERSPLRNQSQVDSEDLNSVKEANLTTEISTTEETTLVPSTDKEAQIIVF